MVAAMGALLALGLGLLTACEVPVTPAKQAFDAWKADDPAAATPSIISSTAKTALFSKTYHADVGWLFVGCQDVPGGSITYCTWVDKYENELIMGVTNSVQRVDSIQWIPLGSDVAGQVFHAWRMGDSSAAAPYATPTALWNLFSMTYRASDHWAPDGTCDGTAGSLYCTFRRPDSAGTIVLRVSTVVSPNQVVEVTHTVP